MAQTCAMVATFMSKGVTNMPALSQKIGKNHSQEFSVSCMADSLYSNRKYKVESLKTFHFDISTLPSQGQKNLSALGGSMTCL